MSNLAGFVDDIARARSRRRLTQTLSPDFPTWLLPHWAMRAVAISEISRYDERGGEGTEQFQLQREYRYAFRCADPWVTGRDQLGSVDTIDPRDLVAGACVIDCSREAAANGLRAHGAADRSVGAKIKRSWVLFAPGFLIPAVLSQSPPGWCNTLALAGGGEVPARRTDIRLNESINIDAGQGRNSPPNGALSSSAEALRTAVSVQPPSASLHRRSRCRSPAEDQAGLGQSAAGARDRAVSNCLMSHNLESAEAETSIFVEHGELRRLCIEAQFRPARGDAFVGLLPQQR